MKGFEKHDHRTRRLMLKAGAAGLSGLAIAATFPTSALVAGAGQKETKKIRYSDLLVHELRQKLDEKPLAYLPLGTLEQHGPHLALGADAIQSEALMLEAARRYGGIVFPPIHISPGPATLSYDGPLPVRMDFWDVVYDPATNVGGDTYWIPDILYGAVIDGMLAHCKRVGFRAVFADGHGPSRREWVRELNRREEQFGLKLFGVTTELLKQWKSQTDHAARNETSLMLHHRPDLVDMSRLPESRADWPVGVGRGGEDPRDASADYGKECVEASLELMIKMFRDAGI
jgi:creatinine amidohydrolase